MRIEEIVEHLRATRVEPVPIAADWEDGFLMAFWRRPHAYLDETVRAGISVFARLDDAEVSEFVAQLRADLESGEWERRNAELFERDETDFGYRLVIAD